MALASLAGFVVDPMSGNLAARLWNGYDDLTDECYAWAIRLTGRLPNGDGLILVWVLVGALVYLPQLAIALTGGLIARFVANLATGRRGSVAAEGEPGEG